MTCLCLTRNRRQWLPQAIRCFRWQTYPPESRELLILADGEDVRDLVEDTEASNVRLVVIEPGRKIGEKRNFGTDMAQGEIVAAWDDDDYSAPGRLADQVDRLASSGKAVTGYHSMLFTDGRGQWWRYAGVPNYALGTSLCYRREWGHANPFQAIQVGEDGAFVQRAYIKHQLVSVDARELMVASVHGGNTSPRNLSGSSWKKLGPMELSRGHSLGSWPVS